METVGIGGKRKRGGGGSTDLLLAISHLTGDHACISFETGHWHC